MAQTEGLVTDNSNLDADSGRTSSEIRSEIDRTRSDMDETFAALDAKMTPKEVGLELWDLFKGGSSTGASKLWQVVREHPMPSAVVGLGLGVESSRQEDKSFDGRYRGGKPSYAGAAGSEDGPGLLSTAKEKVMNAAGSAKDALSTATEKVGDAAGWTQEHASELGHQVADKASSLGHQALDKASGLRDQAKRQVRRARLGFWQTLEENPLMVGAAVLAVGVVAGLMLPSTDKEDELMGETRDRLLDDVKEAGQLALDKGKHVAEAVVDKVKEEAQHQGLTPEGVVEKVKTVAKEATNTAKDEARKQNLTPEALLSTQREPELVNR